MSLLLVLSAALLAQTPAGSETVAYRDRVTVVGDAVRLGDVAELSSLPGDLRGRAEALVVARFTAGQTEMSIRADRLAEKARALIPALAGRLPAGNARPILVRRDKAQAAAAPVNCLVARRDMTAGETPVLDDFVSGPCAAQDLAPAFRYDASQRIARLNRDLKTGDRTPAPPASVFAGVRAGQPLMLAIKVGPVTVQRQVAAVRSSAPGQPVFVRGDDGAVFSAPAPGGAP